jgi:hypothetical protein
MKNIFKKMSFLRFALMGLMIAVFNNCTDRWEDMNTDPGQLKLIPDEYLFTSAVRGAFNDASGDLDVTYGGQYAHIYIASSWVRSVDLYQGISNYDDAQTVYSSIYRNTIKYAIEVMKLTDENGAFPNKWRRAQAKFMAIIGFTKLTDAFGDIPYLEAGMAKYGITQPKYDTQEFIYSDMIARMDSIIKILQEPEAADHIYPEGIDPIYNGNVENWIRFANSYRLNLAMRVRFVKPEYEDVIRECFSLPLIENNDQNPTLETSSDPANSAMWNGWYYKWQEWESGKYYLNFSEMFIKKLKDTNDPRLPFFSIKSPDPDNPGDSIYKGIPNGLINEVYGQISRGQRAAPSGEFFARDQPGFMLTAAQVQLYKAEALLFNIISGEDVNNVYQNAISLAMRQWKIKFSDISNYIDNEPEAVLTGVKEDDFRKISTQFWISTLPNAYNAWTNIRRTGYPVIPQRTSPILEPGVTNGFMPVRMLYPTTGEKSNNGKNLEEALDRLGVSENDIYIDKKLWWDVRDAIEN